MQERTVDSQPGFTDVDILHDMGEPSNVFAIECIVGVMVDKTFLFFAFAIHSSLLEQVDNKRDCLLIYDYSLRKCLILSF